MKWARVAVLAVAAVGGCHCGKKTEPSAGPGSAAAPVRDPNAWKAECEKALAAAPSLLPIARPEAIFAGCNKVGGFGDLRDWIGLRDALGMIAKEAAKDARLAGLLAKIDLPMPPFEASGAPVAVAPVFAGENVTTRIAVTVVPTAIYVGALAVARLDKTGFVVQPGIAYPGELAKPEEIEDKLGVVTGEPTTDQTAANLATPILLVATMEQPADHLVDAFQGISGWRVVHFAVAAPDASPRWPGLAQLPIVLARRAHEVSPWIDVDGNGEAAITEIGAKGDDDFDAFPALSIGPDASVASLAKVLARLSANGVTAVALAKRGTEKDRTQPAHH